MVFVLAFKSVPRARSHPERNFRNRSVMKHTHIVPIGERRGIALMLCAIFLFSSTALLLSYVNRNYDVSGWVATAYRALVGLTVVFCLQGRSGKLTLHRIFTQKLLFTRGLVGGLTIPLYYITIMQLGAGRASMITGSYPLFATVFAVLLLREPTPRSYYTNISIALISLVVLFADNGLGKAQPLFDALALCGAAAGGICVVMIRHLRHTETTSNIFAAQCVFSLIFGILGAGADILITDPVILSLVLLAAFTVVTAQLCLTESFRHLDVAKGSTLQMLSLPLTALASAILLHESFSYFELIGGAGIIYASYRIVTAKKTLARMKQVPA